MYTYRTKGKLVAIHFIQAYAVVGESGFPLVKSAWIIGLLVKRELLENCRGKIASDPAFSAGYLCEIGHDGSIERGELVLMFRNEPASELLETIIRIGESFSAYFTFPGNIYLSHNHYVREGEYTYILKWLLSG